MGGDVVQGWLAREWAQGPRDGDPESSLALRHARTRCGDETPASQQGVPTRRRVRQGLTWDSQPPELGQISGTEGDVSTDRLQNSFCYMYVENYSRFPSDVGFHGALCT